MIHEVVIKWHDLVEDPSDLPPWSGWYMVTTVMERMLWEEHTVAILHSCIEAHYDIETKTWTEELQDVYKMIDNVTAWANKIPPYDSPSIRKI